MRDIALKVLQRNSFFAHPEYVIIAILGDENKLVRDIAVDTITSPRETLSAGHTDTIKQTSCKEVKAVRKFKVPSINENVTSYHQLVELCLEAEPPLLHHLTNDELKSVRQKPLFFKQPCHSQAVERYVKLVNQASDTVADFGRRDGLIRQMINLQSLMKKFHSKKQFV